MQKFRFVKNLMFIICAIFFFLPDESLAQSTLIKGEVVDEETGESLIGVSIRIKNNTRAYSVTDKEGKFSIRASSTDVLVFSYIGFVTKEEIVVNVKSNTTIKLNAFKSSLSEVVVIGYGTVQRKDLTGSVSELNIADMNKAPVVDFSQALAGRVAGVTASSPDGQPGVAVDVVIRGGNSLTQSNTPLYVIDGFPIEDFDALSINMNDIESVNILKDASATAIYGSRGANGVIVIESKKGKAGKPTIDFNSSYGHQEIQKRLPVMSPYDFVRYQLELSPTADNMYITGAGKTLEDYKDIEGINWQEEIFQNGSTQINNIAVRGGNQETKYTLSGSHFGQGGTIINSGLKRYQGRFTIDQQLNRKVNIGLNTNYSNRETTGQAVSSGEGSNTRTYLMSRAWGFRPVSGSNENLLLFEVDDSAVDGQTSSDFRLNPLISTRNDYNKIQTVGISSNGYINYKINPSLTLRVKGGYGSSSKLQEVFYNSKTHQGSPFNLSNLKGVNASSRNLEITSLTNANTLTWNKTLNRVHRLNLMGGSSSQSVSFKTNGHSVIDIPNEELLMDGLDDGIPYEVTAFSSKYTLSSFFGRANYSYNSKYLFTATLRADGSSKFSQKNKWGYFPSVALAWNMTSENFLKNQDVISFSKLRVTYGVTGNNRVGNFAYLPSLGFTQASSYSYGNNVPSKGIVPENMGNSDLRWESTGQTDIGYDLNLFNNRVKFTVDAYKKTTKDLLLRADLPATTGFTFAFKNVGRIENKGLEFSLTTVNVKNKSFVWESNFNISFNRNKILALESGQDEMLSFVSFDAVYNANPLYVSRVGQPYGMFYGVIFDGIYQIDDFNEVNPGEYILKDDITTNGHPRTGTSRVQPGDIKYKDTNGDLIVNTEDRGIIGNPHPKHTGGFSNNFSYKSFDLNVLLQWSYGNQIYNANRIIFDGNGAITEGLNQYESYNDRWTLENPSNTHYRTRGGGPNGVYSSNVLEDGSYLRLKTISLGYNVPEKFVKKLKLTKLRFNLSAQNLLTFTRYTGIDPEVSVRNSNILTPGFDFSPYPMSKTIVFGLNMLF